MSQMLTAGMQIQRADELNAIVASFDEGEVDVGGRTVLEGQSGQRPSSEARRRALALTKVEGRRTNVFAYRSTCR